MISIIIPGCGVEKYKLGGLIIFDRNSKNG